MDNRFDFDFDAYSIPEIDENEELKIRSQLNKNRKHAIVLVCVYKYHPINKNMLCNLLKMDRSYISFVLSILENKGLLSYKTPLDIGDFSEPIDNMIAKKHKEYISKTKMPEHLRMRLNNITYYYPSILAEKFIPFCVQKVLNKELRVKV